ncbi:cytochrome P450 [Daldinia decipiens]|uniref:cytochrome P450 n=1 Tax=Daldinia decipiens TaxID=326647 RepID=UPI0020C5A6C6|nr:cytochrome P450 [Daldinia decipiens]KAI1657790.1 cytochrome P450 [Daldinia decipiens]
MLPTILMKSLLAFSALLLILALAVLNEHVNMMAGPGTIVLYLSVLFISWTFVNSVVTFMKRPKNIPHIANSFIWGKWFSMLNYLFRANTIIMEAYKKSSRSPFAVFALRNYQVLVSSPEHILQVAQAPERVLSFNLAIRDRLEHSAIMLGFRHDNKFDPDGAVTIRAVKVLLRENIPKLSEVIRKRMQESFTALLYTPLQERGSIEVSVLAFTKSVLVNPSIQISYGDELATNPVFQKSVLCYWWDSAYGSAICELLPKSIAPFIGWMFMAYRGSMRKVSKELEALVEKRMTAHANGSDDQYVDLAQFVIASSRTPEQKDPLRLRQLLIAMTFVFAHQPPMSLAWAIIELGQHPEYIELLRAEIHAAEQEGHHDFINHLPLMESVLRESSRLHPLDSLTVQRKAIQPFSFTDGTFLPTGTLVAVPQQAIMKDAEYYPNPDQFDPFRFHPGDPTREAVQKWTDVNLQYPFWGSPARSCPGRWVASHLMKQFLVQFLENYEFELLNPNNCESVRWTTAVVPKHDIHISIRPRKL